MPLHDAPRVGRARGSGGASAVGGEQPLDGAWRIHKTSELVAMQIVEDIVREGRQPGDRLPLEAAMVAEYRVSRASLREALRLLEVQGLITLRPGRGGGPTVGVVDPEHLARTATLFLHLAGTTYDELLVAHVGLEAEASRLAAGNPDRAAVTALLAPSAEPVDPDGPVDDLHRFHAVVLEATGNRVFRLQAAAVTHIVRTHMEADLEPAPRHDTIVAEHRRVAQAILAGDAARAADLTARHLGAQLDVYRERWARRLRQPIEWR
jgi:GntR family transcriptional regulator, transcriptional repressor for pyruvate dehydrogenase complex